ncbi:hypothetical protein PPERSA_03432 [Pseudocohnilembus persalinus]|uniref:Uncharacterized protein n=1 Tax=Pseudocohnilembus persalinus TaxID=266149 RepID=A0A0V0QBX7_PSEPJ|nr:hypothetical protein PPERSA_03432 [Pseudocohnilembus persalinus]|eukprot:KRW99631.1 hypothetical protein PPERSA_03432 [Pseudocohnilembus persalinus]
MAARKSNILQSQDINTQNQLIIQEKWLQNINHSQVQFDFLIAAFHQIQIHATKQNNKLLSKLQNQDLIQEYLTKNPEFFYKNDGTLFKIEYYEKNRAKQYEKLKLKLLPDNIFDIQFLLQKNGAKMGGTEFREVKLSQNGVLIQSKNQDKTREIQLPEKQIVEDKNKENIDKTQIFLNFRNIQLPLDLNYCKPALEVSFIQQKSQNDTDDSFFHRIINGKKLQPISSDLPYFRKIYQSLVSETAGSNIYNWVLYDNLQGMINEGNNNEGIFFKVKDLGQQDMIKLKIFDSLSFDDTAKTQYVEQIFLIRDILDFQGTNKLCYISLNKLVQNKLLYSAPSYYLSQVQTSYYKKYFEYMILNGNNFPDPIFPDYIKQINFNKDMIPVIVNLLSKIDYGYLKQQLRVFETYIINNYQNNEGVMRDLQRIIMKIYNEIVCKSKMDFLELYKLHFMFLDPYNTFVQEIKEMLKYIQEIKQKHIDNLTQQIELKLQDFSNQQLLQALFTMEELQNQNYNVQSLQSQISIQNPMKTYSLINRSNLSLGTIQIINENNSSYKNQQQQQIIESDSEESNKEQSLEYSDVDIGIFQQGKQNLIYNQSQIQSADQFVAQQLTKQKSPSSNKKYETNNLVPNPQQLGGQKIGKLNTQNELSSIPKIRESSNMILDDLEFNISNGKKIQSDKVRNNEGNFIMNSISQNKFKSKSTQNNYNRLENKIIEKDLNLEQDDPLKKSVR